MKSPQISPDVIKRELERQKREIDFVNDFVHERVIKVTQHLRDQSKTLPVSEHVGRPPALSFDDLNAWFRFWWDLVQISDGRGMSIETFRYLTLQEDGTMDTKLCDEVFKDITSLGLDGDSIRDIFAPCTREHDVPAVVLLVETMCAELCLEGKDYRERSPRRKDRPSFRVTKHLTWTTTTTTATS